MGSVCFQVLAEVLPSEVPSELRSVRKSSHEWRVRSRTTATTVVAAADQAAMVTPPRTSPMRGMNFMAARHEFREASHDRSEAQYIVMAADDFSHGDISGRISRARRL